MSGTQENEQDLVDRARKGDLPALDRLVSLHYEVVYRVAYRILRDEDAAADATQSSFLRAFHGISGFRGTAPFRSWLLAITRNQALGVLRARKRRSEVGLEDAGFIPDGGPSPSRVTEDEAEQRKINNLLADLPDKQRRAVFLRIFEDLSFREIGRRIGSSEGAARVNYHNGIGKLRKALA